MPRKPIPPLDATEVQRRVEERRTAQGAQEEQDHAKADMQRLIHELQVHQVELEMQNEELHLARELTAGALEKYSDLYDFAPVSYLTLDREGSILEANLATTTLLGIDRSQLVGQRLGSSITPTDRPAFASFLAKVFEGGSKKSCEVTLLKSGRPGIVARIGAVMSATAPECRAVVEDVTERTQLEMDRFVLGKLESTGILAGGIAHDFNNLLTVVLLNLELARSHAPDKGELMSLLEDAENAALSARGLTRQLITFSKGGAPVRKPTRLSHVIEESVRPALSGSRVRCALAIADDLWAAEVDEGQIGQVLRNLVLNARESMPEGGLVSIRAENVVLQADEIPSVEAGDHVRIRVSDQGHGIPRETVAKVFDPYFSTKLRGNQKGMGLGLTICRTIVQKHAGTLTVESEEGVGSVFQVFLPACRLPTEDQTTKSAPASPRFLRILVMDDEEVVRNVVGETLRMQGHEVRLVEEGRKAIEVFSKAKSQGHPFDLVLLDLTVRNGLGGGETIRELLKIDPSVRALIMSGYSNDPVIVDPGRHGFKGVLVKPFVGIKLQEFVAKAMVG